MIYETDTGQVYAWSGTAWVQYRQQADTGWQAPFAWYNGASGLDNFAYRVLDGVCYVRGRILIPAGMAGKSVLSVTAANGPASPYTVAGQSGAAGYATVWTIGTNGIFTCSYQETSATQYVSTGWSWPIG